LLTGGTLSPMSAMIELTDPEWAVMEDLADPTGRRGIPARYPRRQMVEAILFLARLIAAAQSSNRMRCP
jgi:hypothetical protein